MSRHPLQRMQNKSLNLNPPALMTTTSRSTRCKISWPDQYFSEQLVLLEAASGYFHAICPLALLLVVLRFAGHHLFWQVHGIHADCPFLKMILWWCPLYWLNERLVPSKHWNWCPSVKISCLRDFWRHLLLFRRLLLLLVLVLLLLLLFVTEKRTHSRPADWKVQLGWFRI